MRASTRAHRPWLYPPLDAEAYRAYLARLDGERKFGYLACRLDDDAIVGWLNVSEIVRGALQGAFVGYGGIAAHTGQGYMTEAFGRALDYAFNRLKLHRVEANVQPGNARSNALVTRVGFAREGYSRRYIRIAGRWRDHVRYAMLAEDWRERKRARRRAKR